MYNPLSIYTVIPWGIVFNVSEAALMMILDAVIGEPFNDTVKGSLCLVLFVLNFTYIIYTVVIHFAVIANLHSPKLKASGKREKLYAITFTDLFNMLISASLIWVWLFMALYFFDHDMYTNVLVEANQPRTFYRVYFKFYAYALVAIDGGTTTIVPILTLSELVQGLGLLYFQIMVIVVLAGVLTYLLDPTKE